MFRSLLISGLTLILLLAPLAASAKSRQALVFGIDQYAHLPDLENAGRDAQALSDQLTDLGFEVILRLDADRRQIYRSLRDFENRLSAGGTGVVFFAGHGIQADGRNYLIPANAQVEVEDDLEAEAIDAGRILESMARAGNPLNILILDACRDNPLPKRTRSASRGLTVTSIPSGAKGTAILYAAGEGQVAQDGPSGGHGVFTEALLEALAIPNQKLEEVIKQVTRSVLQQTNGRQRPWSLASIQGDFYFNPKKVVIDSPAATSASAPTASHTDVARDVWQAIKDSGNPELIQNFSKRFADTPYAMAAEARLAMLTSQDAPSKTVEPKPEKTADAAVKKVDEIKKYGPHEMVQIDSQCYQIGTSPLEPGHQGDEKEHQACFNTFMIDRYEVTFDAYDKFAQATGRELPDDESMGRGRRPVINVDWDDARAYAAWASNKYGARFRLPTEAEWEYACLGGGRGEPYCGGYNPAEVAVYHQATTEPVGSKKPNALGLYDMSGNAWEMTCSPYDIEFSIVNAEYAGGEMKCLEKSPRGDVTLVFRGGSWESPSKYIRGARRRINFYGGNTAFGEPIVSNMGFRLVVDP